LPPLRDRGRLEETAADANVFASCNVCEWLGNSQPVATKHYLQVTDEHLERGAKSGAQAAKNQAQQGGDLGRKEVNEQERGNKNFAVSLSKISTSQDNSFPCTHALESAMVNKVGDEGLEPPTLSV
jgi:hypothetical protein